MVCMLCTPQKFTNFRYFLGLLYWPFLKQNYKQIWVFTSVNLLSIACWICGGMEWHNFKDVMLLFWIWKVMGVIGEHLYLK